MEYMRDRSRWITKLALLSLMISAIYTTGCGKTGKVQVYIKDAPTQEFKSVTINLKEVQFVGQDDEKEEKPVTVLSFADGTKVFNLLDFQTTKLLLGDAEIPAGKYNQIRLVPHDNGNTATNNAGETRPLRIASGIAKLVGVHIEIDDDHPKVVTVDWDLHTSGGSQIHAHPSGEFLMTPVLKIE